jgi:hypothetical protein
MRPSFFLPLQQGCIWTLSQPVNQPGSILSLTFWLPIPCRQGNQNARDHDDCSLHSANIGQIFARRVDGYQRSKN